MSSSADSPTSAIPSSHPPRKSSNKVWLITCGSTALGYSVAKHALQNGDYVAIGLSSEEYEELDSHAPQSMITSSVSKARTLNFNLQELKDSNEANSLFLSINVTSLASCQAALAEVIQKFQKIDIVVNCTAQTYVGAMEETTDWQARAQFDVVFFGTVNMMKTALTEMRRKGNGGHIINITSLTGELATPGLSLLTAAHHALEGFTEALAYEVAPFNIKLTNIQPSVLSHILTHPLYLAPGNAAYKNNGKMEKSVAQEDDPEEVGITGVHQLRKMLGKLDYHPAAESTYSLEKPVLSTIAQLDLVAEAVKIIMAVAGKDNPPTRVIVKTEHGEEDEVQCVKDRMKTVSEEMEEFLSCSLGADVGADIALDEEDREDVSMTM